MEGLVIVLERLTPRAKHKRGRVDCSAIAFPVIRVISAGKPDACRQPQSVEQIRSVSRIAALLALPPWAQRDKLALTPNSEAKAAK